MANDKKQSKPSPSHLGTGMASNAARALQNRHARIAEYEAAAMGVKPEPRKKK